MARGVVERCDDVCGGGDREDAAGDAEAGVVVDDVQDLDDAAVAQRHVGDVHLPALVGQRCCEARVGGLRPFVRLGDDEAPTLEHPPDTRDRTGWVAAVGGDEVGVDRVRSRVDTELGQLLAQLHDLVLDVVGNSVRRLVRSTRARDEGSVSAGAIAGQELIQPRLRHAMRSSDLPNAALIDQYRLDHEHREIHWTPPPPVSTTSREMRPLCHELTHPLRHAITSTPSESRACPDVRGRLRLPLGVGPDQSLSNHRRLERCRALRCECHPSRRLEPGEAGVIGPAMWDSPTRVLCAAWRTAPERHMWRDIHVGDLDRRFSRASNVRACRGLAVPAGELHAATHDEVHA